jgi:hypothetical protein
MATIDRPKDEASAEPASTPPPQVAGAGDSVIEWAAPEPEEEFYFWGINELYVAP